MNTFLPATMDHARPVARLKARHFNFLNRKGKIGGCEVAPDEITGPTNSGEGGGRGRGREDPADCFSGILREGGGFRGTTYISLVRRHVEI